MGYVEIFHAGQWDHCDSCMRAVPKSEGVMKRMDGESVIFLCYRCEK